MSTRAYVKLALFSAFICVAAVLSMRVSTFQLNAAKTWQLTEAEVVKVGESTRSRRASLRHIEYSYSFDHLSFTAGEDVDVNVIADKVGDRFLVFVNPNEPTQQIRKLWTEGLEAKKNVQIVLAFVFAFLCIVSLPKAFKRPNLK